MKRLIPDPSLPKNIGTIAEKGVEERSHDYVCFDCGIHFLTAKQKQQRAGYATTFHMGTCCLCGMRKGITHIRHYNWLNSTKDNVAIPQQINQIKTMSKTKIVLPDKTEAEAHFEVSVTQDGEVAAGYQKVLVDTDKNEEVNDGEPKVLTLTDAQKQQIIDALNPVMSEIITANEAG